MDEPGFALEQDEWLLLLEMRESQDHGAFAVACDGKRRAPAHALDKAGLARWCGDNWGSGFWAITDKGREFIQNTSSSAAQSASGSTP